MVRRLAGDGDGVAVVVGPAGAGKTHALAAAREAWEASGRRVCGAALARRAARELEDGAGIPSTSVAALLDALDAPARTRRSRRRAVLVLDEAGMLPTRELAELVDHARRLDVKLVLVGDHRQLPAIGAGGAFRGLMARLPVDRAAREPPPARAVGARRAAARCARATRPRRSGATTQPSGSSSASARRELRRRLVADWWAARDPDGAVMIAQRRVDVDDLNGRAHALMRPPARSATEEVTVAGAAFSAGDRVVVRRNDSALGVVNGDRGVVVAVDRARDGSTSRLARGQVSLPREYLERPTRHGRPALMHGYAITAHLAQGMTCRADVHSRDRSAHARGRRTSRSAAAARATASTR